MIRRLVVALMALSLALPAVAAARTDPPYEPGKPAQSHGNQAEPLGITFHGRTAASVSELGQSQPAPRVVGQSQPAPIVVGSVQESGFDWGDAAIGAGLTLVATAIAGGVFLVYRRGTGSIRPAPSRS